MNRYLLLLIVMFLGLLCYAQTGYISTFSINEIELGFLSDFTPKTIYVCTDNSLIIIGDAGFIEDPMPWYYVPLIIKLDPHGNFLWHRVIDIFYDKIIGVEIDQNDVVHFVIGKPSGYRVGLIDANGTVTLHGHKSFVNNQYMNQRFNKAIRLTNGEIVTCGIISQASFGYHAALFRLSAVGDSLAATYYPSDIQGDDLATNGVNLALRDDNSLYVACYLNYDSLSILHTDMDGSIVNRYNIVGSNQYFGTTMFLNSDSLSVFTIDSSGGNHNTLLTSIDISGNTQAYSLGSEVYDLCSVANASEYFILLGCNNLRSIRITKFDQFLSDLWSVAFDTIRLTFTYPHPLIENIQLDQEGCIYFVGTSGVTSIVAVKLLPNGQVSNFDDVDIPAPHTIKAYPNPAHGFITIELNYSAENKGRTTNIDIYNIRGQKVRSLKIANTLDLHAEVIWNRRDNSGKISPAGIYLIRDSNNPCNTAKLVLVN